MASAFTSRVVDDASEAGTLRLELSELARSHARRLAGDVVPVRVLFALGECHALTLRRLHKLAHGVMPADPVEGDPQHHRLRLRRRRPASPPLAVVQCQSCARWIALLVT